MPKTYTATEVEEIVRECLGEEEIEIKKECDEEGDYSDREAIARNALRSLALERLEKRLADKK